MHTNEFSENLNLILSQKASCLRFEYDEVLHGFIVDDNDNKINTIPVLEYEERTLSANDSESYTYLSICSYGQIENTVRIKSSELFNQNSFTSRYGYKPFASFDKTSWEIFFDTIRVMLTEIKQKTVYGYLGWNKELDSYLFGNLIIDANNTITIESALNKTSTSLSQQSNAYVCNFVNHIAKNLFSNPVIGYICIIYLMLGHCKQRLVLKDHMCPEFVLSLIGETGSYKTATSIALFNTVGGSVSSFEDTLASIQRMFQSSSSGIAIVDDYKISNSKNDAKFEKLVRLSGDLHTTGKYVVGNKVVDELITAMSVITGEKRPQLQQSSYSRILFADLEKFSVNTNYLTELQQSKAEFNSFVVLFAQYILKNEDFDDDCIALFHKYREELLQDKKFKGMHGRYYSMYAWLAAMWDIYISFLHHYADIHVEFDFKSEIKSYIYSQHCMYDNNPIKLFRIGFMELLDSNEFIVIETTRVYDVKFDIIDCNDKFFLKSGWAYKKICKYWQERGIEFPCSERKLRRLLYDAEILSKHNNKFTAEKKTTENQSYTGYFLLKNLFINYEGENLNEEL